MADRHDWNVPPRITMKCPECGGSGVLPAPRLYVGSDGAGTLTVPARCKTCDGKGQLRGFHPPV